MNQPEKGPAPVHYGNTFKAGTVFRPGWLAFLFFIAASFLLYLPVINRYFVSDDFKVLNRVCRDQIIFIKAFFRPLSDLSIYMNYRVGGLDPVIFNSYNILIHGINAFLLYRICFHFGKSWNNIDKVAFSGIASLLFLTYPFHNEAVVWLLGRGASMACLFCLLALVFFYEIRKPAARLTLVAVCYFISLAAYESTIIFPLILIPLMIREKEASKSKKLYLLCLIFTLAVHLIVRTVISGGLTGPYGEGFFSSGFTRYITNVAKVAGRLFLPPLRSSLLLSAIFILLTLSVAYYISKNFRRIRTGFIGKDLLLLLLILGITCTIPVLSAVSTQTSESDRMLYFPSVFLCMAEACILLFLIRNRKIKIVSIILILCYNTVFLEKNNLNWKKASSLTSFILNKVFSDTSSSKIFFANVPEEIEGAYVFRLGFKDALSLYGVDSTKALVVNFLDRKTVENLSGRIRPVRSGETLFIPPFVHIIYGSSRGIRIEAGGRISATAHAKDKIYFWNTQSLEPVAEPRE
jgi:hypothetical protein